MNWRRASGEDGGERDVIYCGLPYPHAEPHAGLVTWFDTPPPAGTPSTPEGPA